MRQKIPTNPESVIYSSLTTAINTGPFTWEATVLSDDEKKEEVNYIASRLLNDLIQQGFSVTRHSE